MTAAATLVSQHPPQQDYQGKDFKMLFHPKKIPLEVHNMLSTSSLLGAASFFSWWRHANQSNDFWIETADEMIRVHVAPRRTLFSPAKWKTSNTSLLGSLLSSLVGDRVTESVSVLSEGTVIKSLQDSFQHDTLVEPEGGLWIGRSRFVKRNFEPAVDPTVPSDSLSSHALSSNSPFGMEDEEGRAASRAGGTGSSSPQHLDGARAEDYVDGKQEHEPTSVEEGCRRDEGAHQVHLGRTHQGGPRPGDPIAREANSRLAAEDDQGVEVDSCRDDRALRQVQGMALSRGACGLSRMGNQGSGCQSESPSRLGSSRQLGKGGACSAREGQAPDEALGSRPGGHGKSPTSFGGRSSRGDKLRLFMEPSGWFHSEATPNPSTAGDKQQRRRDGREGGDRDAQDSLGNLGSPPRVKGPGGEDHGCQDGPSSEEVSSEGNGLAVEYELCGSETDSDDGSEQVCERKEAMTMSPRQRAVQGHFARQEKRRKMNRSTAVKLKDQVKLACQVFISCSLAMASHVGEVLAEPVVDVFSVFTPSTQLLPGGGQDVQCLELFAGKARISEAFAKRGRGVLAPRDIKFGHDFRNPDVKAEILREVRDLSPGLVWLAPPCTLWGNFSRLNYGPQELRRLRKREIDLVRFCNEVMQLQTSLGKGQFVLENPRGSDMWRTPELQSWISGQRASLAKADLCSYGMQSVDGEHLLRKPVSLLCSNEQFAEQISRLCPGDHEHLPIQGANTAHSGIYPTAFASAVVKAFDRSSSRRVAFPTVSFPAVKNPGTPRSTAAGATGSGSGSALAKIEKKDEEQVEPYGASAITFKGKVNPMVAATLKRVHQNLGHPPNRELVRHLKIGGAPQAVLQAAEQLVCRTCDRCSKTRPHKVATPVTALDFNEVVAADIIWIDAADAKNKPALNVVDMASTYQVVIPLPGIKSEDVSRAFSTGWIQWAGIPKQILVDLDSAFKDRFLNLMDEKCIIVRAAAGQAHWQNGVCERHGGAWKEIWAKLVEEQLVLEEEVAEASAAVSDAKNQLRNRSGYSPRQWVFGTNGRQVGDLFDGAEDAAAFPVDSADSKFARSQVLRAGARAAFYRCQTQEALSRAVNHKPRVASKPLEIGDLAYIYREHRQGRGKKPSASWTGPAVVIGKEGSNYWLARGGRCLLAAPEHLRLAEHEEVSEALRVKLAMREVKHMLMNFQGEEYEEVDDAAAPDGPLAESEQVHPGADMEVETHLEGGQPQPLPPSWAEAASREERIKTATRRMQSLDDVPTQIKKARVFMVKRCISEKGKEKQLEKELPWGLIPPDERQLYKEAELKQWKEHVDFGAVRALSAEESQRVREEVSPDRILRSRFAYKDKNYAKRKCDASVPPKPKARLCIAGHMDPDLGHTDMAVDAPTTGRHSILLALQLALCRSWKVSTGDIKAAFLNGVPAPRKLFFSQPRGGMPTLEPGQLIEVVKGVFGLSTSPKLWWIKLSTDILEIKIKDVDAELFVTQNVVDPCVFQFVDKDSQEIRGLLLTHVDDIMLLTEPKLMPMIQAALQQRFPVDEWISDDFEYVGCEYKCTSEEIHITQKHYTDGRVDKVTAALNSDGSVSKEQIEENRTSIGSLSWLAKQTRPDLQFMVSQAQKHQNDPSPDDIKKTNKAVDLALMHSGKGITLRKMAEEDVAFVAFHDAAWGNVLRDFPEPDDEAWNGSQTLASQLGSMVLITEKKTFSSGHGSFSIVDWKSKGSQRVCRSTFAGETMACGDGIESALFLRCLFLSMCKGRLISEEDSGTFIPLHTVTDCKSLFDHLHREGVPKAPTEKRLAIDLAGLRQVLMREARHQWLDTHGGRFEPTPDRPCRPPIHWLPTHLQLADVLTKGMSSGDWWQMIEQGVFNFPFRK